MSRLKKLGRKRTTATLAVIGALAVSLLVGSPAEADVVIADVPVGAAPHAVAVGEHHADKVYVATDSGLSIINPVTRNVITLDVGGVPQDVAIHQAWAYVSVSTGEGKPGFVALINGETNQIVRTYPTGVNPGQILANNANGKVYVAFKTGITVLSGGDSPTTLTLPAPPRDMSVDTNTRKVYVANGNSVTVIDGATNAKTTVDLGAPVQGVASNRFHGDTYATTVGKNGSAVVTIDWYSNTPTTVFETFKKLGDVYTDGNSRVYVASSNGSQGGSVLVFDVETRKRIAEVGTSGGSGIMAGDRYQGKVYSPNLAGGATIIDHANATTTVRTGSNPVAVAFDLDGRKAYIANKGSNTVTVIDATVPAPVKNDFNGDRKTDVLARDAAGALWLYPGDGAGSWLPTLQVGSGWNGMTALIAPGDFNGDGNADVLARDSAGALWLYPGNGSGGWLNRVQAGSGWSGMTALTAASDFNGDGKVDVTARDAAGALWLYPGNGAGGWLTRTQIGTGWAGMSGINGVGDFNGDGTADVAARDGAGILWLYPGNGYGGWLSQRQIGQGWNVMNTIVAPGDFNGDGKADILARGSAGELVLFAGSGGPAWPLSLTIGQGWGGMTAIF
ncbi:MULTISPECIES: FG-GAP-like repeat-containing protein [unclassified Arthrobacter]|uniref:FG-GAP-like repeat-containing protein n=1 Tax=unclassified Arthrobacter TaxID=235627 RepID=UPI0028831E6A|nr:MULTISPECIES: FG-GAP-like repeat-containing protein [unclassified Arthrobacter]